jgi:hypothetical protein
MAMGLDLDVKLKGCGETRTSRAPAPWRCGARVSGEI